MPTLTPRAGPEHGSGNLLEHIDSRRPTVAVALHVCTRPEEPKCEQLCRRAGVRLRCLRIRHILTGRPLELLGSAAAVCATAGRTAAGRRLVCPRLYPACGGFGLGNWDEAERSWAGIWISFLGSLSRFVPLLFGQISKLFYI